MPARSTAPKKSARAPRSKPEDQLPAAHDWRTTDEQEVLKRQIRAREESMRLRNEQPEHPIFSNFEVRSESGLRYRVEIRDVKARHFSCTCADFRKNGLGTCKHVEAVLLSTRKKTGRRKWEMLAEKGSPRVEVGLDDRGVLRVRPGYSSFPRALQNFFDPASGEVRSDMDVEEALVVVHQQAERNPGIRISQEVAPWREERSAATERLRMRREYEQNVRSGHCPAQETLVPLFPYQREGMLHLAFTERALLADEMGLGKTIQAIAACALLHRLGKARRVLVVTPASLKAEWEEQIGKFTLLGCRMVFGGRVPRLACYTEDAPFFTIVNYEQMVTDALDVNARLKPDIVVLDEAQRIKNWNTKTAQAIKRLESRYAFVLTGTPIENRIDELYSLIDFLDSRVLGPLFRFNREYYELDDKGRPKGYRNLSRLHERIRPLMLRRRKAQVETELPDRTDRNHFVALNSLQRDNYADHEHQVAQLAVIAKRRPLRLEEQKKLLRELAMMRMICDSNHILDPEDRESPKIDELRGILEEALANDGVKVIIFSEWERMLDLVRDLCRDLGTGFAWHTGSVPQQKRRLEINAFKNDPHCRVFLSTDAGATGLNLQNASVVINCDLPWNPAKLEQRIARAWRKNQTRAVTVINLIAENTIEHRMLATLADKSRLSQGVLDDGTLDTMNLRGGRESFFKRLEQMLAPQTAGQGSLVPSIPVPADPSLALAQAAARALGPLLWRCEEHPAITGRPPVCLIVVERDPSAARDRLRALIEETGERRTLEIIDRDAFESLQRLAAAGLIQVSSTGPRELYPVATEPPAPRVLTAAERAQINALADTAERQLRLADVLAPSGFADEARAAWVAAATALASGLAAAARADQPPDLAASLQGDALARWGAAGPSVQSLTDPAATVTDELPAALRSVLKTLR